MSPPDPHVEVVCDVESILEVDAGGNVSIRCEATPGSRYMWTKVTWRSQPPCSADSHLNPADSFDLLSSAAILTSDLQHEWAFPSILCLRSCQFSTSNHIYHIFSQITSNFSKSPSTRLHIGTHRVAAM